jgi:hexosaminidase
MISALRSFAFLTVTLLLGTEAEALWPHPRNVQNGEKALRLANNFKINVVGHSDADLTAAISRTQQYLKNDKLGRLVLGRGSGDVVTLESAAQLHTLTLSWGAGPRANSGGISREAQAPLQDRDEAYTLSIPDDGSAASLYANSSLGLFRGLTTFSQLWYTYEDTTYALELPITIEDSPAYV